MAKYINKVIQGDCLEKLKELDNNSVDSIVTDPPYELGFMGKSWDNTGIANNKEMWAECLRVLKPGGHLLAFSGTRTYHRMAVAIEDAGFEVRDMIEWVYGSGFPKSLNIGKAVDKLQGNEREDIGPNIRLGDKKEYPKNIDTAMDYQLGKDMGRITKGTSEWEGWGTALKPAHEPICMARKPLAEKTVAENCLKYGTGGINIDESRVGTDVINIHNAPKGTFAGGELDRGSDTNSYRDSIGRFPANLLHDNSEEVRECFPETGSPRKARTAVKGGCGGALGNFGGSSPEAIGTWPEDNGGNASRFFKSIPIEEQDEIQEECTSMEEKLEKLGFLPEAAKSIIYQAKASKSERDRGCENLEEKARQTMGSGIGGQPDQNRANNRNNHPTVKPIALMEYLIKMVTPKGGIVLDPFAGSGSTLVAAKQNGFGYIGIEMTSEYIPIIEARLKAVVLENKLF